VGKVLKLLKQEKVEELEAKGKEKKTFGHSR